MKSYVVYGVDQVEVLDYCLLHFSSCCRPNRVFLSRQGFFFLVKTWLLIICIVKTWLLIICNVKHTKS